MSGTVPHQVPYGARDSLELTMDMAPAGAGTAGLSGGGSRVAQGTAAGSNGFKAPPPTRTA